MTNKTEYRNLEIVADFTPKTPFLEVKGEVLLYPEVKNVVLIKAMPQGIVPHELILKLQYSITGEMMKGTYHPLDFTIRPVRKDQYISVRIIHDGIDEQSFPVKVVTPSGDKTEKL